MRVASLIRNVAGASGDIGIGGNMRHCCGVCDEGRANI